MIGQDGAAWDDAGEQKAGRDADWKKGQQCQEMESSDPKINDNNAHYGINITCSIGRRERIRGGHTSRLRCFTVTDNIKLSNAVRYPIMCLSKVMIWTWCCST